MGHTLIVPRHHYEDIRDCPASFGEKIFEASQRLSRHYGEVLGTTQFNLMNASGKDAEQSVQHLHFHYLPRFLNDSFSTWPTLPAFSMDLDALLQTLRLD